VISASQVEQLMDSLQHIVATDDDDDEVQLANLAVQQRRGRYFHSTDYLRLFTRNIELVLGCTHRRILPALIVVN